MKKTEMEKELKAYEDIVRKVERITSSGPSDYGKLVADGILPGYSDHARDDFYAYCIGAIAGSITGLRARLEAIENEKQH